MSEHASTIRITVNGKPREAPATTTIAQLLAELDLPTRGIAVERNMELASRRDHAAIVLADGDRLEIVTLVGGG